MLDRIAFLSRPVPKTEAVAVPALGGEVMVRQMTIAERDKLEIANAGDKGRYFRPRMVVASAVDETGAPLFTDADVEALSMLAGDALEPIVDAAIRLNKYSTKEVADLEGE